MMLLQSLASTERVATMLTNFVMLPLDYAGRQLLPVRADAQRLRPDRTPDAERLVRDGAAEILDGAAVAPVAFAAVILFVAAAWLGVGWRVRRTAC